MLPLDTERKTGGDMAANALWENDQANARGQSIEDGDGLGLGLLADGGSVFDEAFEPLGMNIPVHPASVAVIGARIVTVRGGVAVITRAAANMTLNPAAHT
jgi:hypothetical protein